MPSWDRLQYLPVKGETVGRTFQAGLKHPHVHIVLGLGLGLVGKLWGFLDWVHTHWGVQEPGLWEDEAGLGCSTLWWELE